MVATAGAMDFVFITLTSFLNITEFNFLQFTIFYNFLQNLIFLQLSAIGSLPSVAIKAPMFFKMNINATKD